MAEKEADLYSILLNYSNKFKSPYVEVQAFLDYLGRSAPTLALAYNDWRKWVDARDREDNFWTELEELINEGKCERLLESDRITVYLPHFHQSILENVYLKANVDAGLPFPNESSLGITIPENHVIQMNSTNELLSSLYDATSSEYPMVRIIFSDGFGSGLVLSSMVPRRLMEIAIIKIRDYLGRPKNKEYAIRRLTVLLKCKEAYLQGIIDQINTKLTETCSDIEAGKGFANLFWRHFSTMVKADVMKKVERLASDIAAYQAFSIIETINAYYQSMEKKRQEVEDALNHIEENLAKPPYFFTMGQILKFTDANGHQLLGQYSTKELEKWLWDKITESKDNELPVLFLLSGTAKGEKTFVLKEKMLPLCFRLMIEGQGQVKNAILRRWKALLSDYAKEPAMDNDKEFELLLPKIMEKTCPFLLNLLSDPRLLLISQEMEKKPAPLPAKIYEKGLILPYSTLLTVRRSDILSEAKLSLSIWYSFPLVFAIASFFKWMFSGGRSSKVPDDPENDNKLPIGKHRSEEIRIAAKEMSASLTPLGQTQDQYLEDLEGRWCQLLDKQARENLVADVQALARDTLRHAMKTQKNFRPTHDSIRQIAWNVVNLNQTLSTLSKKEALFIYLEVYVLRLIENMR